MAATIPRLPKIKQDKEFILTDSKQKDKELQLADTVVPLPIDEISYSSKLGSVEAQRIMAVIQEIQKKVALIGLIPETLSRNTSTVLSGDALGLLKEYTLLEQKYKNLVDQKGTSQALDIKECSKSIRTLTRTLCRYFIQNPSHLMKLRYLQTTKMPVLAQFEHRLQEIKMLIYERLKTSVEEESQKQDQLSIIIAKEQKTSNEVKQLRDELEKSKKERSAEISKRNEVIRRLKDELREIKSQAEETTKKLESRSKQKEDTDIKASKEREIALQLEIEALRTRLETETINNREEEALQRKKKFKIESEVENWIHKYDQDLEEKQVEIDEITVLFLEEKSHLDELQAQYGELQKEYDVILENRRKLEEKKKREENELAILAAAALLIQKLWRGYAARKELRSKAEKGKKGGKKK